MFTADHPILRQVLGRVHCCSSNLKAIRACVQALKNKYLTFCSLSKQHRRSFMQAAIEIHKQNRELFNQVMG